MNYRNLSMLRRHWGAPAAESARTVVQVQTSESRFMRVATMLNILASTVLAGAALWIGHLYKAQEQLDQKARDAQYAKQAIFAARYQCRDLTYKAIQALRQDASPNQRKDAASFIGAIDTDCRRVGEPIASLIDVEKLSAAQPPEVRQSIAALRRKLATPLPVPKAADVEDIVATSAETLTNVGELVNVAAYGGGAVLTGTGLLNFKKHVDNPSANELRKTIDSNAFEANF